MLWNLCDAKVKAQVRKRIEKSRTAQRVVEEKLAKY
jgi:hypothetical protein